MMTHRAPTPAVSVVMACYNEQSRLGRAIESLQAQTVDDWELILIDDGSRDDSVAVAERYARGDDRIRLYRCGINIGLPACLNIGIFLARADYIARADADDISLPERLERQLAHMQKHTDIDVLGTGAYLVSGSGSARTAAHLPSRHSDLVAAPFEKTLFFHPSVLIRRRFFDRVGVYDVRALRAQDKDLWLRGLKLGAVYGNLPECLIEYSTHDSKRSWRSIIRRFRTWLVLARRHEADFGFWKVMLSLVRSIAIKLGLYRPRSLQSPADQSGAEEADR